MKFDNHTKLKVKNFENTKKNWQSDLFKSHINDTSIVLDIGCAAGKMSHLMNNKNNYYGIEYNEDLVKFGLSKGLKIFQCDLSEGVLPIGDNSINVIWFRHVMEHLEVKEQVKIMREIYRVLVPGGKVIIIAPTPYHWFFWDNCTHVRPCTHGQLETLAKDVGFTKSVGRYSLIRKLPHKWQRILRVTPLRWVLWETYLVAIK